MHQALVAAFQKGPMMVETSRDLVDAGHPQADLLGLMSHEIRTPLSTILGFAQLLDSGLPAPTIAQKRSLALILRAGWHLEKLIGMTRDLALIESGRLSLTLDQVSVEATLRDCQELVESRAKERGIEMTFPVFESPCFVAADSNRLQQALGDLLSAAIESGNSGGTIVVACDTGSSEWIRIGINEDAETAFARQPTPSPEAASMEGLGIDLRLAMRLIGLMGGYISISRTVDTATAFSFHLKRMPGAPLSAGNAGHLFQCYRGG
jgi:signal transduction histidine kinase